MVVIQYSADMKFAKLTPFNKGLAVILLAFIFLGGAVFINRVVLGDAFNREEAQHALYGLWLCKDVRALDFGAFWYDTQRQMFWPFLHSWILSAFFFFFGISFFTARLLSFVIFFAVLFYMYLIANELHEKSGWKIG